MTVDSTPNENPADHDRTARRWRNGMDRRRWTLVAVCGSTFMLLVDIYIVQVALPTIHRRLGGSFTDLQWVIDAYTLGLAALILTCGALSDRSAARPWRERKRVSTRAGPRTSCSPCDARSHALSELSDWRSTDVS